MIPAFSNITESGFNLLENILQHPDSVPGDFLFDDPTVDGQLELLLSAKLASIDSNGILAVTELGRVALKEHDYFIAHELKVKKEREDELATYKAIASSLQKQLEITIEENKSSQKEARFAKIISILSLLISICAIIVPVLCS